MKIATIDADHIFFMFHQKKVLDSFGEPIKENNKFVYEPTTLEEAISKTDNYITNILNVTNASHYVGFFGGSSKSRLDINPDYKQNRKDFTPPLHMQMLKNHLAAKWKFHWLSGCIDETDDYCASFVKQTPNSFIISPDKDLLGLESNHYNPKKNEWVYTPDSNAINNFWCSMICGDTVDNIFGLKNRGIKFYHYLTQDVSPLDAKVLGNIVFEAYVDYYQYNYDLAIEEFYKNYKSLKIKEDLIIDSFVPIEWNNNIINDLEFDINQKE